MRCTCWFGVFAAVPVLLVVACGTEAAPIPDAVPEDRPSSPKVRDAGREAETGPTADPQPTYPFVPACVPQPSCDDPSAPVPERARPFTNLLSEALVRLGEPRHRGRDGIYATGDTQWILGKIAYGAADVPLVDEDVDVYVERDCDPSRPWEKLGTAVTTSGTLPTIENVPDDGGHIYFAVPQAQALAEGRHRVRLVVAGDLSFTELIVDIVAKETPLLVSTIDGTLTDDSGNGRSDDDMLLESKLPGAREDAAAVFAKLAQKGSRAIYVTPRSGPLTGRTREFLAQSGFPIGIVHTLPSMRDGDPTRQLTDEIALLRAHGLTVEWAFGGSSNDASAYANANVPPDRRILIDTDAQGGRRIQSYEELLSTANASAELCL
ncbi:phosphatidylinositol transfer protein, membrane-associated 2 [Labilithrix luteola]|uniref:Phosphatidylinositol transfer protein, membrane-associated 2 n=1 Tax=Labilithrix luteola TaxID=1391654 RepID=A0A0K1Q046_9BACT|nr:hypothetical protein [Labilithrix luteola]AKU99011.1 phosphatidylinositol transfer protein, membrane-associated 2 [Labilithrix luteola]